MSSKPYSIREYIPSFQLQILLELVDSISKLENLSDKTQSQRNCVEKKLNFIKHKCPILPTTSVIRGNQSSSGKTKGFTEIHDHQGTSGNTTNSHHHEGVNGHSTSNNIRHRASVDESDLFTDFDEYNKTHNLLLLSEEGQESAIALAYFLTQTKAKSNHTDQILPLLVGLVNHLPHCKWHPRAKITGEFFSYHLVSLLREISNVTEQEAHLQTICKALIDTCLGECYMIMKSYESKFIFDSENTARVLYGVFKALSEGLPKGISKEQLKSIADIIQYFFNITSSKQATELKQLKAFKSRLLKSMIVLVLKILIQTTYVGEFDEEFYSKLIQIAFRNLSLDSFKRIIETTSTLDESSPSALDTNYSINAFGNSADLAVQCSIMCPKFRKDVLKVLIECLDFAKRENVHPSQPMSSITSSSSHTVNKFEEKMCKDIVLSIERLCKEESDNFIVVSVKALREFISEDSTEKSEHLVEELTLSLCRILNDDFKKRGIATCSSAIYAISNIIYMNPNDYRKNNRRVTILGTIAQQIDNNAVTDLILPVLTSQLTKKKNMGKLDNVALRPLSNCIHLGNGHYFSEIVELIFGIYQNPFHSSETVLGGLLIDSIYIMNKMLKNHNHLRLSLLVRLIKLINRLGGEIQIMKESNEKKKDMLKHIAVLMPAVATLTKSCKFDIVNHKISDDENVGNFQTLFRIMWFYLIIFKFTNPNEHNDETYEACQTIGMNGPILLNGNVHSFMEINKEIEVIIDSKNMSQEEKSYLTTQLESCVNIGKDIAVTPSSLRQLSIEEVLFLISTYNLELFRARSGSTLKHSLYYLEHYQIFNNPVVILCLQALLKRVFDQWLCSFIKSQSRDDMNSIIEEQCILLFKMCIHRLEIVRQTSHQFIVMIIKLFPAMYWSSKCLSALLEIISALYEGHDKGKTTDIIAVKIPAKFDQIPIIKPFSNEQTRENSEYETFYLPEHFTDRNKLLDGFTRFSLSWISKSMSAAPNVTQSGLQHYLIKFQQSEIDSLRHFGYTFAVYLSTPTEHLQAVGSSSQQLKNDKRGFSILSEDQTSLTQSVSVMSFSCGEANSLKLMLGQRGAESEIVEKISTLLKEYSKAAVNPKFYESLSHVMRLATAFILSEKQLNIELLQWVVWTPVYIFTRQSMEIAIYCWNWIAGSRGYDLTVPLLTEISNAWQFTIQKGYGLFCGHHEKDDAIELAVQSSNNAFNPSSPFASSMYATSHKDTYPHRIWINYLAERFQSGGVMNEQIVDVYLKMLVRAVENIGDLSKEHFSLGTRFRLASLSLQVSRSVIDLQFTEFVPMATILQHRTFAALLNWFTLHPTWYDPGSNHMVQEDLKVLSDVQKRIRREQKELNRHQPLSFDERESINAADNVSVSGMSVSGRTRSVAFSVKGSVISSASNWSGSDHGSLVSVPQLSDAPTRALSDTRTVVYSTSGVDAILDVLLLLIGHESERITIWNEPQKADETVSSVTKISPNKWKIFIDTAWSFSPKLAIKMHVRFPFDCIRDELEKLVRKFPRDAIHIPEATDYLVTEANVKANAPELYNLLIWAPATLSIALRFLNSPFVDNVYVQQYAIRTLRKFSPEAVVFYLPQIVQCLRHDHNNALKRHIISVVRSSVMFTHQLIWTLRTEIVETKELTPEELGEIKPAEFELSAILKPFYIDVIKAFDANQIRLYKEEFHFFDKITTISGDLIPVEKEKRQARLLEEMKLVKPSRNLYTPTNTQYKIIDLDANGSRTLKSAKKVPILIPFYVKQRPAGVDIGEDSEDDYKDKPTIKLPCIFKAGDDCRHDQLALQIISMFKRVFEILELPLYLFPYRVITTGRGLGIIECVPNSKSRHQIGESLHEGDNLYNYFIRKYGNTHTVEFQKARRNFIHSMAAYSIVSFILSIKDRHNGNIMLDEEGHVIHIDFGFIFDISPGGKFGIEQVVPFKLTTEMLAIMGEEKATISASKNDPSMSSKSRQASTTSSVVSASSSVANGSTSIMIPSSTQSPSSVNITTSAAGDDKEHSEPYNLFVDLMIRGYLAARDHMDSIVSISHVMVQSGLPCFAKDGSIDRLKQRLCAGKSEREAVQFIKQKISASYQNVFSVLYDIYQERFEGVNR
ncbi:hypothetical protein C9374_000934 [Naegleria lovaniensis]|uniref:1-phosphatidylinositol 4-kinase n=1 Tax=Naegleria lovaniensis TaxID=51637 RepID=A0AA88GYM3_NAELO|nr:uncharacterized protein C9374_000934 [Naegleria lovaniensis]KAG2388084.1 hypothetical protein C9374_000934 [Naegleria lovaniensis]